MAPTCDREEKSDGLCKGGLVEMSDKTAFGLSWLQCSRKRWRTKYIMQQRVHALDLCRQRRRNEARNNKFRRCGQRRINERNSWTRTPHECTRLLQSASRRIYGKRGHMVRGQGHKEDAPCDHDGSEFGDRFAEKTVPHEFLHLLFALGGPWRGVDDELTPLGSPELDRSS